MNYFGCLKISKTSMIQTILLQDTLCPMVLLLIINSDDNRILGIYLRGLFDSAAVTQKILQWVGVELHDKSARARNYTRKKSNIVF